MHAVPEFPGPARPEGTNHRRTAGEPRRGRRRVVALAAAAIAGTAGGALPAASAVATTTPPTVESGQVSCRMAGTFTFSPALTDKGHKTTGTVGFTGTLKGCSGSPDPTVTVKHGTIALHTTGTASNDCGAVLTDGSALPTLTGRVLWKVAGQKIKSSHVSVAGASFVENPDQGSGGAILFTVPSGGGTVTKGSFPGPFAWPSDTADESASSVLSACGGAGVASLSFTGTPVTVTIGTGASS